MSRARDFGRLQERLERLKKERAKAEAVYEEAMRQIRKLCGARTLAEAKQVLESKQKQLVEKEAKADRLLSKFEKEFGDVL